MKFIVSDLIVNPIRFEDEHSLQSILEESSDYFELTTGYPTYNSAAITLSMYLPEGKDISDKLLLGVYELGSGKLIGVVDVIKDYPQKNDWFIGFMMIAKEFRYQGMGSKLIKRFISDGKEYSLNAIHVSVPRLAEKSVHFFEKVGFNKIREDEGHVVLKLKV